MTFPWLSAVVQIPWLFQAWNSYLRIEFHDFSRFHDLYEPCTSSSSTPVRHTHTCTDVIHPSDTHIVHLCQTHTHIVHLYQTHNHVVHICQTYTHHVVHICHTHTHHVVHLCPTQVSFKKAFIAQRKICMQWKTADLYKLENKHENPPAQHKRPHHTSCNSTHS